jgi:hypothetical protein
VADDLPQAVDDLRRDWSTRRIPTWAIDTALPDPTALDREGFQALPPDQQARLAARLHAQELIAGRAITDIHLPDRAATLGQAEQALHAAHRVRAGLDTGYGVWTDTEAGQAVRDLAEARAGRERAESISTQGVRWRDRRGARKEAADWTVREADAQQRWSAHVAPEIARLDQEIARHQATLDQAAARLDRQQAASNGVIDHGLQQQRNARNFDDYLKAYRDKIDGVPSAADIRKAATLAEQHRGPARLRDPEMPIMRQAGPDL